MGFHWMPLQRNIKLSTTGCLQQSGFKTTFIILHESINSSVSDYWRLVQIGRNGENDILIIILTFKMPSKSKFSIDESVKIVK